MIFGFVHGPISGLCGLFALCLTLPHATGRDPIPTLTVLQEIVGEKRDSKALAAFLERYRFNENPKRNNSWGSAFGVFVEIDPDGHAFIGMRPPSAATNMPTYPGKLPRALEKNDTIATIQQKLGKPTKVRHDPEVYFEMIYDTMTIYTMRGRLFEVWLMPKSPK